MARPDQQTDERGDGVQAIANYESRLKRQARAPVPQQAASCRLAFRPRDDSDRASPSYSPRQSCFAVFTSSAN